MDSQVPPGSHVLTWVFHKEREYSWMEGDANSQAAKEVEMDFIHFSSLKSIIFCRTGH